MEIHNSIPEETLAAMDWHPVPGDYNIIPPYTVVVDATHATPKDIADRRAYQIRRFQELREQNQLTPPWIKFGIRHKEEIG